MFLASGFLRVFKQPRCCFDTASVDKCTLIESWTSGYFAGFWQTLTILQSCGALLAFYHSNALCVVRRFPNAQWPVAILLLSHLVS